MIPGYNAPSIEKPQAQQHPGNACQSRNDLFLNIRQSSAIVPMSEAESFLSKGSIDQTPNAESATRNVDATGSGADLSGPQWEQPSCGLDLSGYCGAKTLGYLDGNDILDSNHFFESEALGQGFSFSPGDASKPPPNLDTSESEPSGQHDIDHPGELGTLKEEFPPSPSDHQSILVSLSTRCVWKGSVCERAHLFRIKYYGNFDKPLGRFLRDHLFDQVSNFPRHVYIYTNFTKYTLRRFQILLLLTFRHL